jgi:hypothetical protein
MKLAFETRDIALSALAHHPDNVRAASADAYGEAPLAALAANIRECGLLQPLLVTRIGEELWGVLAGGRRFAALKLLAKDKTAKGFTASMPCPAGSCRRPRLPMSRCPSRRTRCSSRWMRSIGLRPSQPCGPRTVRMW